MCIYIFVNPYFDPPFPIWGRNGGINQFGGSPIFPTKCNTTRHNFNITFSFFKIYDTDPMFFDSLVTMFPNQCDNLLRLSCVVYYHDVYDRENSLSVEMIIKLGAASNNNDPGSAAYTSLDQIYLSRYKQTTV